MLKKGALFDIIIKKSAGGYYEKNYYVIGNGYNSYGKDVILTDEFKKPYHPTFSIESRYYRGQPYAVDWNKEPYKSLAENGIL